MLSPHQMFVLARVLKLRHDMSDNAIHATILDVQIDLLHEKVNRQLTDILGKQTAPEGALTFGNNG